MNKKICESCGHSNEEKNCAFTELNGLNICQQCIDNKSYKDLIIAQKDQHIAELKSEVNNWKQRFNASEKRYTDLMQSNCECIRAKEESFKKIIDMLNDKIKELQKTPLLVEDGSADIEKLINDGFRVIVYRQGSTPPQWLKD